MADPMNSQAAQNLNSTPRVDLNVVAPPQSLIEPGGFWRRFVALFLDSMILGIATFPISITVAIVLRMAMGEHGLDVARATNYLVSLIGTYYYYGYFYSKRGATPGKMVMGLQVLREDGTHLSYSQAFGREFVKGFLMIFTLFVSVFMAGMRKDKKALHDLACKTRVVHVKK